MKEDTHWNFTFHALFKRSSQEMQFINISLTDIYIIITFQGNKLNNINEPPRRMERRGG